MAFLASKIEEEPLLAQCKPFLASFQHCHHRYIVDNVDGKDLFCLELIEKTFFLGMRFLDDDDDDDDDDIYIMVKCMSVCLYVTFLLTFFFAPPPLFWGGGIIFDGEFFSSSKLCLKFVLNCF